MNSTCKLIKELREESGLTASEFAKVMGVSKSSVSRWESDETPGIENLYQIARYFRVSVDELLNGQRNEDSNFSLFVSKYDLSSYDVPKLIEDANVEELVTYFKKCQAIKARFLKLLPRAAYSGLANIDLEEYKYISQYIGINSNAVQYEWDFESRHAGKLDPNEMKAVREFYERIKDLSKQEKEWELEKIIYFRPQLFTDEVIGSKLFEPFNEMYKLLPQVDKNSILNNTINRGQPIDAIRNRYVLAMISNGGKVLRHDYWHADYWDDEVIKAFDGIPNYITKEKQSDYQESEYFRFYGECSYQDYAKVIDEEKTILYKEACLLRRNKPIDYYKKLKSGGFDNLLNF